MGSLVSAEVEWVWGLSALTGFPSTVRAMRCLLFWAWSVCHFPSQRVLEALGSYVAVILPAPLLTWNKTWTKQTLGWVFLLRATVFFALDLSQKTKKPWSTEHWWIVLRVEHLIWFWKHAARTIRNKQEWGKISSSRTWAHSSEISASFSRHCGHFWEFVVWQAEHWQNLRTIAHWPQTTDLYNIPLTLL